MLTPTPDIPGLWPLLRRDERLSGHQPLGGKIERPVVAWRQYLGGPHFDARLIQNGHGADLLLPYGGCLHRYDAAGKCLWTSSALGIESIVGIEDVDADGAIEIVASNGKSLFVLDARTGDVLWQEYLGPPFAGGFMNTGARLHRFDGPGRGMQLAVGLLSSKEVVVFDFSAGASCPERRHILWMDDFFHPSLIAADLDNDGRDELVITKLSAVYAFDVASGEMTGECRWSSGGTAKRNYGMLEAEDLDGSGALDLVVISDRVSRHIAVVANDGSGGLVNRWDRFIEHIYESDERELRFVSSSVVDIDGDGRFEIVVSIFNERGDNRWWLEVIDAVSGELRLRHPDVFLRGVDRERPGARPRLLVSNETNRVPSSRGPIAVLEWRDNGVHEIWSHAAASFVGRFAEARPHFALFRTDLPPADDAWVLWVDGDAYIPILDVDGLGLLALSDDGSSVRAIPETSDVVAILAVGDLDGDGRDELVVADARGLVTIMQGDGTVVSTIRGGMRLRPGTGPYYMAKPMSTAVVGEDAQGRYCAVPDAGTLVHVFRWNDELGAPELVSRPEMRGRTGPEEAFHSISLSMLDDELVVLGASVGDGRGELVAVDTAGVIRARWPVPSLPASPSTPMARTGIHEYAVVETAAGTVLVVSGFRSPSMNSELTMGLALDGSPRWSLEGIEMPGHVLGPGPWNALSVDRNSDSPTIHFLAKDTLIALDAATGAHVAQPLQLRAFNNADMEARGLRMDDFSAYGSIVPMQIDGRTVRLLIANYGGHGAVDLDGYPRWWRSAPLSELTGGFGGLVDIDGDGRFSLGVGDATGDFICIDAATGVERWRLHLGAVSTGVATCDIDGDGRGEFVVATREGLLIAIGAASNGSGLVKWTLDLGYTLGQPIIADFDGDGSSEILIVSGDGHLYSIAASCGAVS